MICAKGWRRLNAAKARRWKKSHASCERNTAFAPTHEVPASLFSRALDKTSKLSINISQIKIRRPLRLG